MRELLLLRHAKSSWDDPELSDHERPLTKRGTKAADRMGRYIVENDLMPDLILCSDAIRARATLALVLNCFDGTAPKTLIAAELYLAGPDDILSVIQEHAASEQPDREPLAKAKRVLVVGHNPGIQALALSLTRTSKSQSLAQIAVKFPTAALAHLTFATSDWSDIRSDVGNGTLHDYVTPRALDA